MVPSPASLPGVWQCLTRRFLRWALGGLWEVGWRPVESQRMPSATAVRPMIQCLGGSKEKTPAVGAASGRPAAALPTACCSGSLRVPPPSLEGANVKNPSCHIKASPRYEKCLSKCVLLKRDFHSNLRRACVQLEISPGGWKPPRMGTSQQEFFWNPSQRYNVTLGKSFIPSASWGDGTIIRSQRPRPSCPHHPATPARCFQPPPQLPPPSFCPASG